MVYNAVARRAGSWVQQRHFALFALAAVTGAAFWYMDGLMKGYQYRYYVRMREIESAAYLINRVIVGGEYGLREISAPRIDMTWPFTGYPGKPQPGNGGNAGEPAADNGDWRADEPWRRTPQEINEFLRHRFALPWSAARPATPAARPGMTHRDERNVR
jgi:hypothetical protein